MSFLNGIEPIEKLVGAKLKEYDAFGQKSIQLGDELKPLVAEYERDGVDLKISDVDSGDFIVLKQYFASFPSADLMTSGGAKIEGATVSKLAGPGPVAQSSTQNDASPIGQIEDLSGTVTIKHADGTSEQAFEGTPVFKGDILETESDGDFSITFIDDTKFSMGPNGRAVLDEMIYNDQNTANNGMGISLLQGVFTFVSGKVAKDDPEGVSIKTPVGTIGIRGTSWSGKVAQIGEESLFTLFTGAIVVANEAGSQLLTLAKQSVILVSSTVAPSQPFVLTDEQLIDAYGKVLSLINPDWWKEDEEGFDPSQINPQAGPGNGGSGGGGAGFSGPNLAQLGDGLGLSGILELSDLLDETDLTEDELRQLLDPLRDPTAPDIEVRVVTITDPETSTVSAFNIEVLLDVPAPETVTIFYEIQPGTATGIDNGAPGDVDFLDEGGGVIVIPAGSTAGTFSIVLVDDDVIENTEFFIVQLTDAINANIDPLASSALIVIEDDDVGVISIQPVVPEPVLVPAAFALLAAPSALASESDVEIEEGTGAVEFKLILDKAVAPGVEVRVDYVVTGEGVARTGLNEGEVYSATFSGGESGLQPGSELIVSIDILDDDLYQGDQDFVIQIVGGSSNSEADEADNTLSVTVIDDETPVIVGEGEEGTVSEDEIDDSDLALSLGISGGSGAFQSLVFSNDQSDFDAYGLSSAGIPITLTGLGSSEVIGKAGGVEIFKVVLNSDGTYNLYLSGPLDHPVGEGHSPDVDPISLNFDVVDENGSSTSGSVSFTVEDDVPFAYSDVDTVAEGGVATGNVLTGTETTGDANETDGTADDAGADGISIVSANLFSSEETPETPDESGTIEVTGLYGVLTLYADGRYSYQANDGLDNDIAVVERFTYTIEDGDGDKSSAEITIGIEDALTPEIGSVADVSLDEDDLPEGSDQTKEPVTAGAEIPITFNGDDPGAVTLDISGLPDVTSQGDPVEYTIETLEDGVTQRVTATAVPEEGTPREVFVLDFAPNGNGENYSYSVTLADVLDHPNEGEDEIVFSFGVDLEDQDGSSVSGGFDFKVVDDTPVATSDLEEVVTVPKPCFNLVFVLDTSGSMNSFVPGATEENPTTYMDVLRESVVKLLGSYDEVGIGFNLTFIDFDSDAEVVFSGTSIEDAIVFVENASNLVPGGATNYAAALANDADGAQGVLTGHLANPDLDDFFNTVYFISDGAPFPSSSQVPLGDNLENPWQLFVDGNDIEVISVGIGENLDVEQLNRVENSGDEATVIVDANELETELEETVPEVKEGNIVSSGIVDRFGADGATVAYISFLASDEDLLVLYEDEGANIVEVFDGVFRVEFNIPQDGTELIVDLPYGSEFSIDSSGNYVFEAAAGVPAGTEHKFEYVLVDGDLDTDSAELKFLFINEGDEPIVVIGPDDTGIETVGDEAANVLAGDALNDTLSGEGGDDTLIGGGGDDSLEGGAGADTFEITEADGGNIIIADMDVAEDLVSLDGLFDALSVSTEDRDQGEAWELEIVSGFATLTVTAPNGPSITFENIVDPGAEDLSQLASRIIVGDES